MKITTEKIVEPSSSESVEKAKKHAVRKMAHTVAAWVSDSRERRKSEEASAVKKFFAWENNFETSPQS